MTGVRPVPAGVRVSFIKDGKNTYCTKGFNVKRNGVQGFIVNSHCTRSRGFVDGVRFYNNFVDSNNAIGVETVDPPYYRKFPQCPPLIPCRRSDSAFAQYGDPSNSGKATIPKITSPPNSKSFSGLRSVADATRNPASGEVLEKIGARTGWSRGYVSKTCVGTPQEGGRWLSCQYYVKAHSGFTAADNGDSGSPVYEVLSSSRVRPMGILWGDGGSNRFIFSSMGSIMADLGTLDLTP